MSAILTIRSSPSAFPHHGKLYCRRSAEPLSWTMVDRPAKITFAEMRHSGVRGILVYCTDYRYSHFIALMADHWPDDLRLSNIEPQFVCKTCGKRGADVRPNFIWNIQGSIGGMGYR